MIFKLINFLLLLLNTYIYNIYDKPIILFLIIFHGLVFAYFLLMALIAFEPSRKQVIQQALMIAKGGKWQNIGEKRVASIKGLKKKPVKKVVPAVEAVSEDLKE